MTYTKTNKNFKYNNKTYVVYTKGNQNTRYIRLNNKYTSVPSLKTQTGGNSDFTQFEFDLMTTADALKQYLLNTGKVKYADELVSAERIEIYQPFRHCIANDPDMFIRVFDNGGDLLSRNKCKDYTYKNFRKWMKPLDSFLTTYTIGDFYKSKVFEKANRSIYQSFIVLFDEFKSNKLINHVKNNELWFALDSIITKLYEMSTKQNLLDFNLDENTLLPKKDHMKKFITEIFKHINNNGYDIKQIPEDFIYNFYQSTDNLFKSNRTLSKLNFEASVHDLVRKATYAFIEVKLIDLNEDYDLKTIKQIMFDAYNVNTNYEYYSELFELMANVVKNNHAMYTEILEDKVKSILIADEKHENITKILNNDEYKDLYNKYKLDKNEVTLYKYEYKKIKFLLIKIEYILEYYIRNIDKMYERKIDIKWIPLTNS